MWHESNTARLTLAVYLFRTQPLSLSVSVSLSLSLSISLSLFLSSPLSLSVFLSHSPLFEPALSCGNGRAIKALVERPRKALDEESAWNALQRRGLSQDCSGRQGCI